MILPSIPVTRFAMSTSTEEVSVSEHTPLMKQYWDLKAQAGDALLLFRMGDFYELFGSDAVEAASILEITLTSRDKNKANPTPMAGVPHHSAQGYIQRLLKAGKKVAIGEQMEDPSKVSGKTIVRREIVRTFTPGIQFDSEGAESHYLALLLQIPTPSRKPSTSASIASQRKWILACLDASTGEALISEPLDTPDLCNELGSLSIAHLLYFLESSSCEALKLPGLKLTEELPPNYLSVKQALELLKRHYAVEHLGAFLENDAQAHALGVLLTYTLRSQRVERLAHLQSPAPLRRPKTMILGPRTPQHLDLISTAENTPNLYDLINRTRSAMGARQLKRWLLAPLKSTSEIHRRQEAIKSLATSGVEKLSAELGKVYDLERISGRINTQLANPRDTLCLGRSLITLNDLVAHLQSFQSPLLREIRTQLSTLAQGLTPLAEDILRTQRDDAPLVARDGSIFNAGKNAELDRLLSLTENGQRWLIELETREREMTGIPTLKVRYNRVFGYYIEVTQAHLKNVPAHYQRKQTTVGAERFFTEELKKFEDEIVHASTRQKALELQLFEELIKTLQEQTVQIMEAASALGRLDALLSLSGLGNESGWTFPVIDDSLRLEIQAGRHPLVDTSGSFVPNDLNLCPETRLTLMITGPNMGGKSTIMRQTALIVILGQMGAPVPATSARWGVVSSVYTRIGAQDAIARGQSTFMVEMSELAHILHHADENSLIILDEIGRGTSTYDGISVAWSTLEWICRKIGARTLFATHYHELTQLAGQLPLLANAHMGVEGARSALRFLYQLQDGPTNDSFGIHVAQIAGLPKGVIDRAWKVLHELEEHSAAKNSCDAKQLSLLTWAEPVESKTTVSTPHPVLTELQTINVNEMTPMQALSFLARLQEIAQQPDEELFEARNPQQLQVP